MDPYKRFYQSDDSGISIEHWTGSMSQDAHMHKYYELVFIEKGSCTHTFCQENTLLLPGDSFLVRPEKTHSFAIQEETSIYNCQFYPEVLDKEILPLLHETKESNTENIQILENTPGIFQADINKQGIVRLDSDERIFFLSILSGMQKTQESKENYHELLKRKYLETLLVIYRKRSDQQFKNYYSQPQHHQSVIMKTLSYIEENIACPIQFQDLARDANLSTNHFRKLFKDVTGLAPVEYINRLRITKACEYLRSSDLSISEIAANVGIYDQNYFSRLFRSFIGCSPSHYIKLNIR